MRKLLPSNHPDMDDLFDSGSRVLPDWHINITDLLFVSPMERVPVFKGHPNPMEMFYTGEPIPNIHPSVSELLGPYLPPDHPADLDEILRNPLDWTMPDFHPSLTKFIYEDSSLSNPLLGVQDYITLYFDHPDIQTIYAKKERMPEGHPLANPLVSLLLSCN